MSATQFVTDPANIAGNKIKAIARDFGEAIVWRDHKIDFIVGHAAGKHVLDLGCIGHDVANLQSRYHVYRALSQRCASLTGLDLSEAGISHMQALGYDAVFGDAQNFDLGRKFDCIVAGDLIEHLEDFSGFFRSVKRNLAEGGKLVISTPNPWYWRNIVKSVLSLEVSNNIEHTCWLCPRTLRQLAQRHGFRLDDITFGSRYARDRFMPLPRGIKHTSWHGALVLD